MGSMNIGKGAGSILLLLAVAALANLGFGWGAQAALSVGVVVATFGILAVVGVGSLVAVPVRRHTRPLY